MRLKLGIFAIFTTLAVTLFGSCTKDASSSTTTDKTKIRVSKEASSTTGVTISWTDDSGYNQNYTVSVYKDAGCNDLYQEYTLSFGEKENKRFSVPYLDCQNTYYICVKNSNGYKSKTLEVALTSNVIRRNILYQNFDNLFWGYDYINSAHGVNLADINPKTYLINELSEAIEDSKQTTGIEDDGRLLFSYHKSMLKLLGFEGWPADKSKEVRILPGYVKIGRAFSDSGVLCTPTFAALNDATETIEVSFNAAIFASSLQANGGIVRALIMKGDSEVFSKTFNIKGVDGKPSWSNCEFTVEGVTADCHLEIRTTEQASLICVDNLKIVRSLNVREGSVYGYVYDKESGAPIKDVVMSDGFTVTTTDKDGLYIIEPHRDAMYISCSLPADCEVTTPERAWPYFYAKLDSNVKEYNFGLKRLPNGKEDKFALFALADPQVSSGVTGSGNVSGNILRFKEEAVSAIKAHSASLGMPCYGITLGDIVHTSPLNKAGTSGGSKAMLMEPMRGVMRSRYTGMAVFQVMGNHDCTYFDENNPLSEGEDAEGSNYNIKAQRAFEKVFGPINYSFNRGDAHIIGMRNIIYNSNKDMTDYTVGFSKEQYDWLVADLSHVSTDKMVVLCVHIPMYTHVNNSAHYVKEVHELLAKYAEAHILSGHTHYQYNYNHKNYKIYEHVTGAVCGAWWMSNICGDGTPNGYGVYISDGSKFSDWYYMGYTEGMNTRDYQMRLYRGNAITGTEKVSGKTYSGYYRFNLGEDILLANVFNADDSWEIEVYEDDEFTGYMELIELNDKNEIAFNTLEGDYTMESPRHITDGVVAPYDMWVTGIHFSLSKTIQSGTTWTRCMHLYKFKLKDPKTQNIKVVARDRFKREYTETKTTDYTHSYLATQRP